MKVLQLIRDHILLVLISRFLHTLGIEGLWRGITQNSEYATFLIKEDNWDKNESEI